MYVCMYGVCMYVCMYVCVYVCTHVCTYVCVCVLGYVCMYLCMYVCMYCASCFHGYHLDYIIQLKEQVITTKISRGILMQHEGGMSEVTVVGRVPDMH